MYNILDVEIHFVGSLLLMFLEPLDRRRCADRVSKLRRITFVRQPTNLSADFAGNQAVNPIDFIPLPAVWVDRIVP